MEPGPCENVIEVPLIYLSRSLLAGIQYTCMPRVINSAPGAGHQGVGKTVARLRRRHFERTCNRTWKYMYSAKTVPFVNGRNFQILLLLNALCSMSIGRTSK